VLEVASRYFRILSDLISELFGADNFLHDVSVCEEAGWIDFSSF